MHNFSFKLTLCNAENYSSVCRVTIGNLQVPIKAKWAYQIKGQRENFTQANAVLMRLLERHGQLA